MDQGLRTSAFLSAGKALLATVAPGGRMIEIGERGKGGDGQWLRIQFAGEEIFWLLSILMDTAYADVPEITEEMKKGMHYLKAQGRA